MTRIYLPSEGPERWRRLLAEPWHWEPGYSAMTVAKCWEAANGLPSEIARVFAQIAPTPELLIALPEHKVPLKGSKLGASQSDIFVLVRAGEKTIAATIEGKVDESFGEPLGKWRVNASPGKGERLDQICELLGLIQPLPDDVYYQLLHRTASAVIEARRFKTDIACMIVHSFSPTGTWFDAFQKFVSLFDVTACRNELLLVRAAGSPPLYVAWVTGDQQFLEPKRIR